MEKVTATIKADPDICPDCGADRENGTCPKCDPEVEVDWAKLADPKCKDCYGRGEIRDAAHRDKLGTLRRPEGRERVQVTPRRCSCTLKKERKAARNTQIVRNAHAEAEKRQKKLEAKRDGK